MKVCLEVDDSLVRWLSCDDGLVALDHLMVPARGINQRHSESGKEMNSLELNAKIDERGLSLGDEEQAAGGRVEPVDLKGLVSWS